jgi:HNH endonuclease
MPFTHLTGIELFWKKVVKTDTCWNWTASTKNGYGVFWGKRRRVTSAHRYAYEILVGKIPFGHELHHVCRNRKCVRPDPNHVVLILAAKHSNRFGQTHCKYGHPLDYQNTGIRVYNGHTCRFCKLCDPYRRDEKGQISQEEFERLIPPQFKNQS